jgi:hypothetical protein
MRHALLALLALTLWPCARATDQPPPGVPQPVYPFFAQQVNDQGAVTMRITFNSRGCVEKCVVLKTTTSAKLAEYSRLFVLRNWHDPKVANQTFTIPIIYKIYRRRVNPGSANTIFM